MKSNAATSNSSSTDTDTEDSKSNTGLNTLLVGVIGALVGSAGTIAATLITSRYNLKNTIINNKYNLEKDVTKNLHDQRISVYAELLKCTEPLSLHDVSVKLTYANIFEATKRLSNWYYMEKGGILMTKGSEDKYVSIKKALDNYLNINANVAKGSRKYGVQLSSDEGIDIRKLCLDFHSSLQTELGVK